MLHSDAISLKNKSTLIQTVLQWNGYRFDLWNTCNVIHPWGFVAGIKMCKLFYLYQKVWFVFIRRMCIELETNSCIDFLYHSALYSTHSSTNWANNGSRFNRLTTLIFYFFLLFVLFMLEVFGKRNHSMQ